MNFQTFGLDPALLRGIRELGYVRPTTIQADAIPPALEGRDLLASAATGSGKTAAFLLPVLHRLIDRPRGTTRALVLGPTRELVQQTLEVLNGLAVYTPLNAAAVYGGVSMGPQAHAFRSGVDVLVATPGRLLDHLRAPYAQLPGLECLVLDEADRMLDMGFLPEIRRIVKLLPRKRQTLFFSATMPADIAKLASEMLHDPIAINVRRESRPAVGITQAVYPVAQELKASLLATLLERGGMHQALVFTRTKHRADRVSAFLARRGIRAERIHGNRSQAQRTAALLGFREGRFQVLVATDIAARGIDVAALGHVVNFDVPAASDDYIHRCGRTARAEATGEAYTFVAPQEENDLRAIERAIGRRLPRVTVPDFDYTAPSGPPLEIPLAQRLDAIRAEKAKARAKAERRSQGGGQGSGEGARDRAGRRGGAGAPGSGPGARAAARPPGESMGARRPGPRGSRAAPDARGMSGSGPRAPGESRGPGARSGTGPGRRGTRRAGPAR